MSASPLRILVIEDSPLLRAQLAGLFSNEGFQAEFAADGLSGLRMALDDAPDVPVLDLGLPGLDGLHVCERLRAQADRHVPVLMLTARDALDDKLLGFRAGADDYLVKPFAGWNCWRAALRSRSGTAPGRHTCCGSARCTSTGAAARSCATESRSR